MVRFMGSRSAGQSLPLVSDASFITLLKVRHFPLVSLVATQLDPYLSQVLETRGSNVKKGKLQNGI
jgi:hypothetical protein